MRLNEQKIKENLSFPVSVYVFETVDSTNNEAKRRAGTEGGAALYVSSHQTEGRGRRGRSFYSPKDTGLYMTLSLPFSKPAADIQIMTCAAAVACCGAIAGLSDNQPQIKWVNDIFVDGRKAAGILTEIASDEKNQPTAVVIGVGLNLLTEVFPEEFAYKAGNLGDIDPNLLCAGITNRICKYYELLPERGFIEKYRELNLCIGRKVAFVKNGKEHIAFAADIAPDGGLIVEENGARYTLRSGEISVSPV